MKRKQYLKIIITIITCYFLSFFLNNLRNFVDIIMNKSINLSYLTFPILISTFISAFYIFKLRNYKNKYFHIIFLIMLIFYNLCNGILNTLNVNTFFLLYLFLMIYTFTLNSKFNNFSLSLITSFSVVIILTLILGMIGLLITVKYLLPVAAILLIIFNLKKNTKEQIKQKMDKFFNIELTIFTILFVIAIIGGVGRFVHVYDEYSHWAYDAKAVIYYDKLSTSQEIMSKTRGYAPIITCWHYIVAQYAGFQESNLYIGLSIFVSIYLMSVLAFNNNKKTSILIAILVYCSCFIFGGVYSFNSLYADLAFGAVFGASLISIFLTDFKYKKYIIAILLIILTLIKPSGCTASFTILFIFLLIQLFKKHNNILKSTISFLKQYWLIILITLLSFIIWNIYVKITSNINTEFFTLDIRPWTLYSDLSFKLNKEFILNFFTQISNTLDENLISNSINITLYQYILITLIVIFVLLYKQSDNLKESIFKTLSILLGYIVFFGLTSFSIFYKLTYYEATNIASFGRYLNSMNVAMIMLILYLLNNFLINKKNNAVNTICVLLILFSFIFKFSNTFYFFVDIKDRMNTQEVNNIMNDKFKVLNDKTEKDAKVYVIDQQDKDGIMAMWYARYYAFPRKVNASSVAIAWKVKTEKNVEDLQNWGLTKSRFLQVLQENDFEYLYFYTKDKYIVDLLKDKFVNYKENIDLYKIEYTDSNQIMFSPVK